MKVVERGGKRRWRREESSICILCIGRGGGGCGCGKQREWMEWERVRWWRLRLVGKGGNGAREGGKFPLKLSQSISQKRYGKEGLCAGGVRTYVAWARFHVGGGRCTVCLPSLAPFQPAVWPFKRGRFVCNGVSDREKEERRPICLVWNRVE